MSSPRVVILHNIISPYKTLLFNELATLLPELTVLYISETEGCRDWEITRSDLKFDYEVMFDCLCDEVAPANLFLKTFRRLQAHDPEVLIIDGYVYASSWAGLLWAKLRGKPVVLWSSSSKDDHPRQFIREFVKGVFVKLCSAYNVYSSNSREYLVKLGARKDAVSLVGNNTDNRYYHEEAARWREHREDLCRQFGLPTRNFLYVGRFSPEKNVFSLLQSYAALQGNGLSWGLVLVGDGPQKQEINNFISDNGLMNIALLGFLQKDKLPMAFAMCDVLVLPSISETWGLVVNEAMAAGLPVIVSRRCGCYPDLVRDGINGFSFEPTSADELTNHMVRIMNGEVDFEVLGRNAVKIVDEFSPRRAAERVAATIASMTE